MQPSHERVGLKTASRRDTKTPRRRHRVLVIVAISISRLSQCFHVVHKVVGDPLPVPSGMHALDAFAMDTDPSLSLSISRRE